MFKTIRTSLSQVLSGAMLLAGLAFSGCASVPAEPKPALVVAHLSDIHLRKEFDSSARFRAFLHQMRQEHPEISCVINTGDTLDGAKGKWEFWTEAVGAELQGLPVYSVLGNHDSEAGVKDPAQLCAILGIPSRYYSFDRSGWHFIALDGNSLRTDEAQMAWLVKELETVPATTPVAILSHQPILSVGADLHSPGDIIARRGQLVALFAKHRNVKLCLSGHVHLYDQILYNGVTYACGGSVSGYWWEREKSSDGKGSYHETPPGFGLVKLYADGTVRYDYLTHTH